jgi:hypothetical protein
MATMVPAAGDEGKQQQQEQQQEQEQGQEEGKEHKSGLKHMQRGQDGAF